MFVICAVLFLVSPIFTAEINSACRTPNGENGTCIPVNSCRPIQLAISYFDKDAIEFARNSQCGFEENKPLVCCGSVGTVTLPPSATTPTTLPSIELNVPSIATPINHLLLPDRSLCGLQIPECKNPNGAAESMEVPWLAALIYTKEDGTPAGYRCSGSLINPQFILTAAQCLSPSGYNLTEVRLGVWKLSAPKQCTHSTFTGEDSCENPVMNLKVAQKIPHPYHNIKSGNNDIGLIRLEKPIKYNDFVRPICLPPSDFFPPENGTLMDTAGWALTKSGGLSDVKLKRQIVMVGPEACNTSYPNYLQAYPNKACVRPRSTKVCNGDSGSPLMRIYDKLEEGDDQEQWFQEGILYKGLGCESKNKTGLYMRVSRYIHWIISHLSK